MIQTPIQKENLNQNLTHNRCLRNNPYGGTPPASALPFVHRLDARFGLLRAGDDLNSVKDCDFLHRRRNLHSCGLRVPSMASWEMLAAPFQYQMRRHSVSWTSRPSLAARFPANTPERSPRTITYFPMFVSFMLFSFFQKIFRISKFHWQTAVFLFPCRLADHRPCSGTAALPRSGGRKCADMSDCPSAG